MLASFPTVCGKNVGLRSVFSAQQTAHRCYIFWKNRFTAGTPNSPPEQSLPKYSGYGWAIRPSQWRPVVLWWYSTAVWVGTLHVLFCEENTLHITALSPWVKHLRLVESWTKLPAVVEALSDNRKYKKSGDVENALCSWKLVHVKGMRHCSCLQQVQGKHIVCVVGTSWLRVQKMGRI